MQAAKYLNVSPWDLLEQTVWWRDKALIAMSAEAGAQEEREKHRGSQA